MLNKIFLIGNLVADPEIKYTPAGTPVGKIRLACTEKYRAKGSSELKEQTLFVVLDVWDRQATTAQQYLHKGSRIFVEGKLVIREYEQDGVRKWFTSVRVSSFKFLDRKGEGGRQTDTTPNQGGGNETPEFDEEDIPFS